MNKCKNCGNPTYSNFCNTTCANEWFAKQRAIVERVKKIQSNRNPKGIRVVKIGGGS